KIFSFKSIVIASLAIIAVTGCYPAIGGGLISLIISRGLVGASCSILSSLTVLLITDSFKDNEQKKVMGQHAAVRAIGSMSMMIIVYLIARTRWRNAFIIYILAIPVLAVIYLLLPKSYTTRVETSSDNKEEGYPKRGYVCKT